MSSATPPSTAAYEQLSPDDHGPSVIVATYILIVLTITVVTTRLLTRYSITRKLVFDDLLIVIATVLCLGQSIAVTVSANNGLGRHESSLSASDFNDFSRAMYSAEILAIPTLALAKVSATLLILGISPPRVIKLSCWVLIAITTTWAIALLLATMFSCSLPQPWNTRSQCEDFNALFITTSLWNILTDIALVLLPFFLMQHVQISTSKRWVVTSLFGSRLIVPVFTIVSIFYYTSPRSSPSSSSTDYTWKILGLQIWTQAILNLSIITACIPCIKRFLTDLSPGLTTINISEPLELTLKMSRASVEISEVPRSREQSPVQSRKRSIASIFSFGKGQPATRGSVSLTTTDEEKQVAPTVECQQRQDNRASALFRKTARNETAASTVSNANRAKGKERSESTKGLTEFEHEPEQEQARGSGDSDAIMQTTGYTIGHENREIGPSRSDSQGVFFAGNIPHDTIRTERAGTGTRTSRSNSSTPESLLPSSPRRSAADDVDRIARAL